jgi:hypothetical protein
MFVRMYRMFYQIDITLYLTVSNVFKCCHIVCSNALFTVRSTLAFPTQRFSLFANMLPPQAEVLQKRLRLTAALMHCDHSSGPNYSIRDATS